MLRRTLRQRMMWKKAKTRRDWRMAIRSIVTTTSRRNNKTRRWSSRMKMMVTWSKLMRKTSRQVRVRVRKMRWLMTPLRMSTSMKGTLRRSKLRMTR